jgi:hypothetical protein
MNAYELADDVKNISNTIEALEWVQKASPLLRQQADRIAELEKLVHQRFDDGKRLGVIETEDRLKQQNAEPVAWINYLEHSDVYDLNVSGRGIPLYTTPHHASDVKQIKELSDEEIIEIGNAVVNLIDSNEGWIEFARAILKKASE